MRIWWPVLRFEGAANEFGVEPAEPVGYSQLPELSAESQW